jgi:hypothetical protein
MAIAPAPASAPPPRPPPPSVPAPRAGIEGIRLEEVDAFIDLSPEMHRRLTDLGRLEVLASDEEVSSFGAALLLAGDASVCATIVDAPACRAAMGKLVPSRGSLSDTIAIRVVAGKEGARVAVWEQTVIDEALKPCPWVIDDLCDRADRIQALAGATMGTLGDVDETSRNALLDRLKVRVLRPFEVIVTAGSSPPGIVVIGAGTIELLADDEQPPKSLRPGELLFQRAVLEVQPAPCGARAGASGAIVLLGEAKIAQQLFASVPPLISLLSGDD